MDRFVFLVSGGVPGAVEDEACVRELLEDGERPDGVSLRTGTRWRGSGLAETVIGDGLRFRTRTGTYQDCSPMHILVTGDEAAGVFVLLRVARNNEDGVGDG